MSVEIDPTELGFRRPFTEDEVGQILKIKNPNNSPVAFKVKTTAPKQYCVRPNSGRIEPGLEVEVTVLLQVMKTEPPADARCRDKFLVQSVAITGDKVFDNVQQIWDSVEKSAIQEKKIRVNWLPAFEHGSNGHLGVASTPVRQPLGNGVEATPDAPPPAYSSPGEDNALTSSKATPLSDYEPEHKEVKHEPEAHQAQSIAQSTVETVKSTAGAAAETVATTAGATYEQLKDQLAKAEARIAATTNDATSGLRQRNVGTADPAETGKAAPTGELVQTVRQSTEGVPIQIVAALCLLSFFIGWYFY